MQRHRLGAAPAHQVVKRGVELERPVRLYGEVESWLRAVAVWQSESVGPWLQSEMHWIGRPHEATNAVYLEHPIAQLGDIDTDPGEPMQRHHRCASPAHQRVKGGVELERPVCPHGEVESLRRAAVAYQREPVSPRHQNEMHRTGRLREATNAVYVEQAAARFADVDPDGEAGEGIVDRKAGRAGAVEQAKCGPWG